MSSADLPFDDDFTMDPSDSKGSIPTFDEGDLFGASDPLDGIDLEAIENSEEPWERFDQKRRNLILLISAIPMLLQPLATTMVVPSFNDIETDLDTAYTLVVLTVVAYNVMSGLFPTVYGPLSDRFGRRFTWYFTLPIFALVAFACGFAPNIWVLILARGILGAFSCSVIIVATGIATDTFPPSSQGRALGIQQIPALLSPLLGYPLGGLITTLSGWRLVTFLLAIGSIPIILLVFLTLPETLPKQSREKVTAKSLLLTINPWNTLKLLTEPVIGLNALARASGYAGMMAFVLLNPKLLDKLYAATALEIGLWTLPFTFGTIVGSVAGGVAVDRGAKQLGRGGKLISANLGNFIICIGLIGYGWLIEQNMWLATVPSALIGFGVCATRPGYLSYAMQENPSHSAAVTGGTMLFSMLLILPYAIVSSIFLPILGTSALFTCVAIVVLISTLPTVLIMGLNFDFAMEAR